MDKSDYLLAMERSPVKDVEIKALLRAALTDRITDRLVYMKGIDASYHYEAITSLGRKICKGVTHRDTTCISAMAAVHGGPGFRGQLRARDRGACRMLRQERQVVFTLRSAAPLDKGLCARLLASLQPDYEALN